MKKTLRNILVELMCLPILFTGTVLLLPLLTQYSTITASAKTYGDFEYFVNNDNTVTVTNYQGNNTDLIIPSEINGMVVTTIERYFKYANSSITSVSIPDTVTEIYYHAFEGCENLTSINVADDNTNYCSVDGVLYNKSKSKLICCPGGKEGSIFIPDGVTEIDSGAFFRCTRLTSVVIPYGVKIIWYYTFSGCESLTSVVIPNTVTSIDNSVFYGCKSLTNVVIPDSVTSIGDFSFMNCSSLTSITIPDSVTRIGSRTFYDFTQTNRELVIYGTEGSYAETYANENGIKFVAVYEFKNSSKINTTCFALGNKLTITGAAQNGTAPYTYAYYFKRTENTKWNKIGTEFGTSTTATLKPASEGTFDIKVIVKDANGDTAEKLFKLTVTPALTNTSWVNAEKVQIGDDIRVEGAAEGGEGGYKYAFYFKRSANSKWNKIGEEFGAKTYGITVPKAAAGYDMKVVVKDSAGNTAQKIFKVTVVESLPLTNISLINTPTEISVGKTVTIAGRQVGGSKPFTYEFYFKRSANSKWNKLSYGSDKHTYAKFTPTTAAEYDLKAVVIDSKGTKAEKIYKITAK